MALEMLDTLWATVTDVLPIATIILAFQLFVLRRPVPHLPQVLLGFVYVLLGLAFFLQGLEMALFPLGQLITVQEHAGGSGAVNYMNILESRSLGRIEHINDG